MKGCGWLIVIGGLCLMILLAPALVALPESGSTSTNLAQAPRPRPTRPANLLAPDYIVSDLPDQWPADKMLSPAASMLGMVIVTGALILLFVAMLGKKGDALEVPAETKRGGQWVIGLTGGIFLCLALTYMMGLT